MLWRWAWVLACALARTNQGNVILSMVSHCQKLRHYRFHLLGRTRTTAVSEIRLAICTRPELCTVKTI